MKQLITILLAFTLIGCEAHLVTKEFYVIDSQKSNETQCFSAKILPVELANEIKSNSIFWIPLIPAPWKEKKDIEKIRIEIIYEPIAKECKATEVNFISEGITHLPEMAFLYEFREQEKWCVYEFKVSGSDVSRTNAFVQLNRNDLCGSKERALIYKKQTVYENHFQSW